MKKTFESFQPCLELREVVFLRTLPAHPHLVPALDIFLDPYSKASCTYAWSIWRGTCTSS